MDFADKNMKDIMSDPNYKKEVNNSYSGLNFHLPHEFGGIGNPLQKDLYGFFNVFPEDADLAQIKPRWTTTNEFMVNLPENKYLKKNIDEEIDDHDYE